MSSKLEEESSVVIKGRSIIDNPTHRPQRNQQPKRKMEGHKEEQKTSAAAAKKKAAHHQQQQDNNRQQQHPNNKENTNHDDDESKDEDDDIDIDPTTTRSSSSSSMTTVANSNHNNNKQQPMMITLNTKDIKQDFMDVLQKFFINVTPDSDGNYCIDADINSYDFPNCVTDRDHPKRKQFGLWLYFWLYDLYIQHGSVTRIVIDTTRHWRQQYLYVLKGDDKHQSLQYGSTEWTGELGNNDKGGWIKSFPKVWLNRLKNTLQLVLKWTLQDCGVTLMTQLPELLMMHGYSKDSLFDSGTPLHIDDGFFHAVGPGIGATSTCIFHSSSANSKDDDDRKNNIIINNSRRRRRSSSRHGGGGPLGGVYLHPYCDKGGRCHSHNCLDSEKYYCYELDSLESAYIPYNTVHRSKNPTNGLMFSIVCFWKWPNDVGRNSRRYNKLIKEKVLEETNNNNPDLFSMDSELFVKAWDECSGDGDDADADDDGATS